MSPLSRRRFLAGAAAGATVSLVRGFPVPAAVGGASAVAADVFREGVASGDPSSDGVVLWTRLDPDAFHGRPVLWEVFPLADPATVIAGGAVTVDGDRDGTVHVPVGGLPAGTELGYRFTADGTGRGRKERGHPAGPGPQIEGRTRTLPARPDRVRIGVTSCGKYSDGWFHTYASLAGMGCDLVLHLGDYIYASGGGADDPLGRWGTRRAHDPDHEVADLAGFRRRYRQYRQDPGLQALHAAVPIVPVWDDNDIANNAFRDGTQADPDGASWPPRKRDGQRAWAEYLPTRVGPADGNGDLAIWRRITAGDLFDLLLLDTRLQRDQQVSNGAAESTAANDDPDRTMLGPAQLEWLRAQLRDSTGSGAAWRVIGQGVVMTHWRVVGPPEHLGRLRHDIPLVAGSPPSERLADGGVYWNSDGWDGYAYERARLLDDFAASGSVVVLTGDVHSSWANELVPEADPVNAPVGVEFVAPAASTRPFASNVQGLTPPFEAAFTAANPWIKFCDMDHNGFLVLDLDHERVVARWYAVDVSRPEVQGASLLAAWQADHRRRLLPRLGG